MFGVLGAAAYFGKQFNAHFYLFSLTCLGFTLFSFKKKDLIPLVFILLVALSGLIFIEVANTNGFFPMGNIDLIKNEIMWTNIFDATMAFSLLVALLTSEKYLRIRYEVELKAHRANLEKLVIERTESLLKAKEEAEKSNEIKNQFLANVSHELRTPLHAILSFSELGGEFPSDQSNCASKESCKPYFAKINSAGSRLLGFLNNVLDLSKLELKGAELYLTSNNILHLINDISLEMSALLRKKSLKVDIECDEYLLWNFDRSKMYQVLVNLLSNAIKFSQENGVINIRVETNEDFSEVELRVKNSGVGISVEERELIFTSFYQGMRTRSKAGGTGIGLTIAKRMIQSHRGELSLECGEKDNTTFLIKLVRLENLDIEANSSTLNSEEITR